jgi:hypothetical protein
MEFNTTEESKKCFMVDTGVKHTMITIASAKYSDFFNLLVKYKIDLKVPISNLIKKENCESVIVDVLWNQIKTKIIFVKENNWIDGLNYLHGLLGANFIDSFKIQLKNTQ